MLTEKKRDHSHLFKILVEYAPKYATSAHLSQKETEICREIIVDIQIYQRVFQLFWYFNSQAEEFTSILKT